MRDDVALIGSLLCRDVIITTDLCKSLGTRDLGPELGRVGAPEAAAVDAVGEEAQLAEESEVTTVVGDEDARGQGPGGIVEGVADRGELDGGAGPGVLAAGQEGGAVALGEEEEAAEAGEGGGAAGVEAVVGDAALGHVEVVLAQAEGVDEDAGEVRGRAVVEVRAGLEVAERVGEGLVEAGGGRGEAELVLAEAVVVVFFLLVVAAHVDVDEEGIVLGRRFVLIVAEGLAVLLVRFVVGSLTGARAVVDLEAELTGARLLGRVESLVALVAVHVGGGDAL